jgi:DNA mismatch repair protein MutL
LDVCEGLKASGSLGLRDPVLDSLVRSVSQLAARESPQLDSASACRLVDDLLRCDLPYACPQGRPTMIQWSFGELERKFGR